MDSKELIGEEVLHAKYGSGIIQEIAGNQVQVYFEKFEKECKFMAPACFGNFIHLKDEAKQALLKDEYNKWYVSSGEQKKDELIQKTQKHMQDIEKRIVEREQKRLEEARREAQRLREHLDTIILAPNAEASDIK